MDLQQFSTVNCYFEGEGKFGLSELIYALKSNKADISGRIESAVKQDETGVYFYDGCENALERSEMTFDDAKVLIENIISYAIYDYLIINIDFSINDTCKYLLENSDKVVFTTINTQQSIHKIKTILDAIKIMQMTKDIDLLKKVFVILNKSMQNDDFDYQDVKILSSIGKYNNNSTKKLISNISQNDILDELV